MFFDFLDMYDSVEHISIINNQLEHIPEVINKFIKLERLDILSNYSDYTYYPNDYCKGLKILPTVEHLCFYCSDSPDPNKLLDKLPNLKTLFIFLKFYDELQDIRIKFMPKLENIILDSEFIEELGLCYESCDLSFDNMDELLNMSINNLDNCLNDNECIQCIQYIKIYICNMMYNYIKKDATIGCLLNENNELCINISSKLY